MASKIDISEIEGDEESLDSVPQLSQLDDGKPSNANCHANAKHNKLQMSVSLAADNQSSGRQHNSLYLYHEQDFDLFHRPQTPQLTHSRATSSRQGAQDSSASQPQDGVADGQAPSGANLGTLSGVYFPCVQNIFGVILFIRMVWIVGTAGVPSAFAIVFICCCVTLTTSISLSAIATNGIVPAGGSYFMISRSLGPECGGAVGTMFFLGTTVAGAMYITGAVEIILNYLAPSWGLFGDFQRDVSILYHNIRVYGSLLLIVVGLMVWIGVKFVSKLAPIALFCVLFSIISIYIGIFVNHQGRQDLTICVVGDRLVSLRNMPFDDGTSNSRHQQMLYSTQKAFSSSNNNNNKSTDANQLELARNKALCNFDKLRYVFCPSDQLIAAALSVNESTPTNQDVADRDSISAQTDSQDQQDAFNRHPNNYNHDNNNKPRAMRLNEIGHMLFAHPANMSNCDDYFKANKHRIRLERAVPGKCFSSAF